MTDENYARNLVLELYWVGFRAGVAFGKSGEPLTAPQVEFRNKLLVKYQARILKRLKAKGK